MRRPGIFAPAGQASNVEMMLSWKPGMVTCYYDFLQANQIYAYKRRYPEATILVRFQHPPLWSQDPEQAAVGYGQLVASKWPELQALDPYICFANELNLYYENGDQNVKNQPMYETEAFYEKIGWWIERTAQVIKDQAPDMKLVIPPFSPGRHEDGAPNDHGQITEAFAGYDYLADTLETYFGSRIAYHAYWGDANGSYQDRLYDGQVSQWYAFRWRRLLKMFEERYGIQGRVIIDEASNYAAYDLDLFDQLTYFSQEALSDGRVLGLSYYLWEDPTFSPGNIFNVWTQYILDMASFTQRLSAIPDVSITKPAPPSNSAISTQSLPSGNPVNATSTVSTASTVSTTAAHDSQFDGITIRVSFEDGRITPMPLESYLRAVVPAEMPALWHPEALKAQAVAARTYAMRSLMRSRSQNKEADITSTFAHSQQFDPSKMHAAADVAILATKGLVLRQNGQIIDALFSANCGGHTRNNEDVDGFSKTPVPYLRGVSCPNPGPKNGHGLGLCQHGARAFAEQGLTYDQILAHYYTNTTLDPMPSV